jgi:hypothetical protein
VAPPGLPDVRARVAGRREAREKPSITASSIGCYEGQTSENRGKCEPVQDTAAMAADSNMASTPTVIGEYFVGRRRQACLPDVARCQGI